MIQRGKPAIVRPADRILRYLPRNRAEVAAIQNPFQHHLGTIVGGCGRSRICPARHQNQDLLKHAHVVDVGQRVGLGVGHRLRVESIFAK